MEIWKSSINFGPGANNGNALVIGKLVGLNSDMLAVFREEGLYMVQVGDVHGSRLVVEVEANIFTPKGLTRLIRANVSEFLARHAHKPSSGINIAMGPEDILSTGQRSHQDVEQKAPEPPGC